MDFYSPLSHRPPLSTALFLPSVLSVFPRLFLVFLFFFLEIISKPHTFRHFHRQRTFAMVIRGIAVKNYPDQMGKRGAGKGVDTVGGKKGAAHPGVDRGERQRARAREKTRRARAEGV